MCAVSVGAEKVQMRACPRQHEHQRVFVLHVFQQPVVLYVTFAKAFFIPVRIISVTRPCSERFEKESIIRKDEAEKR